MSVANIQGQEIDFNIGLLTKNKTDSSDNNASYYQIDAGGLSYLEIEDSLLNPGLTGAISIKNSFQILDRLKALRSTEDTLYLDVNIIDLQSAVKSIVDRSINFLALVENSASITKDITDSKIVLKFEEAQTSMLKKLSMNKLFNKLVKKQARLGEHLFDIINTWGDNIITSKSGGLVADRPGTTGGVGPFFKTTEGGTGNIIDFYDNIGDSVYDVLYRISESILIGNNYVPVLKIRSIATKDNKIERRFTFQEIFTDKHREFLKNINGKVTASSDVYLEEFVLAPQDSTTGLYNIIESYDIIKADIEVARERFWVDYALDLGTVDLTNTNINLISFTDIVDSFEGSDLGGTYNCAIPVLAGIEKKILAAKTSVNTDSGPEILKQHVYSKTKKSFLFMNDSIVFTVKGQIYRQPGSFITINGGEVVGDKAPNNIWFVISVKHKFIELSYESEIVAVRLFGNSKRYTELVGDDDTTTTTTTTPPNYYSTNYARPGGPPPRVNSQGGVIVPGQIDAQVTRYAYDGDEYIDTNSAKGIGNRNNRLIEGTSVALTEKTADALGIDLKRGDKVEIYINNRWEKYSVDDTIPAGATDKKTKRWTEFGYRIDFYDPSGRVARKGIVGKNFKIRKAQ